MKWTPSSLLVGALCLAATVTHAEPAGQLLTTRWTTHDGLPQSSIAAITQTHDGYLWLATFGGLARFDGLRFALYDIANTPALRVNRLLALHEDAGGTLWIGGESGALTRYREGTFDAVPLTFAGPPPGIFEIASDGHGLVVAATEAGLFEVRGDHAEQVPIDAPPPLHAVSFDAAGALWVASGNVPTCVRGACPASPPPETDFSVGGFGADPRDGTLFYVGLTKVWQVARGVATIVKELSRNRVNAVAVDPTRGDVWVGADRDLWRRSPSGWERMNPRLGGLLDDPRDGIRALLVDRDGTLWLGTDRSGLVQIRDVELRHFGRDEGLPVSAVSVLEDPRGRQWVAGNCQGPYVREPGATHFTLYASKAPITCAEGLALAPDGAVLVGDHDGFVRIDALASTKVTLGPIGRVRAMAFDARGHLWVSIGALGVIELDAALVPLRTFGPDVVGNDVVIAIEPAGDTVWLGTTTSALALRNGAIQRWPAPGGARAIHVVGDMAWVGTYGGGLMRLVPSDPRGVVVFTTAQGLCDNTVSRIIDDGHGNFWLNGNRGVARVPIADFDEVAAGTKAQVRCTLIETAEGNGGAQPAGWLGRDGRLWFPDIDGVVAIDPSGPEASLGPDVAPLVAIEGTALDADRGDLVVRYTGLSFDAPAHLRFRHRLLGNGDAWIDAGTDRAASYTNLDPGSYTFEVEAIGPRGRWSEAARTSFTLDPKVWQTTWFLLVMIALGVGLVVSLMQWRVATVRRRNAHYRALFHDAPNGLLLHDADGRLIEANAAAHTVSGLSIETLCADDRYLALVRETVAERVSPGPIDLELGDAKVRAQAAPFDEQEAHALVTLVDLTALHKAQAERREYEQRLQHGQKLEALGLFAGGIAHDFNNHLAAIGMTTSLIRDEPRSPEVHEQASNILTSVERASELVRRLLAFGRQQPGTLATFDPARRLDGFMPLLTRLVPAPTELVRRGEVGQGHVRLDPVLFEQCILNLVVNARDAIGPGVVGTVTIEVARRDAHLTVSVSDTGHGIDAETRAKIFDPFFTTKALGKGTGLGLSITHATVEQAGGFIAVDSEPGHGARFTLGFPCVTPAPGEVTDEPKRKTPIGTRVDGAKLRVLVCDDNEMVRRSTRRILEHRGYAILEADTPSAALALFSANPTLDILLTDVVLPEMSGPELAKLIRGLRPDLPIVLMSGHTRDVDVDDPDDFPFVSKPFTVDRLTAALQAALGRGTNSRNTT